MSGAAWSSWRRDYSLCCQPAEKSAVQRMRLFLWHSDADVQAVAGCFWFLIAPTVVLLAFLLFAGLFGW